jgi:hypothetical protein
LFIPAGQHNIEFRFEPATYFKWNTATRISSILILLILAGAVGLGIRGAIQKENVA